MQTIIQKQTLPSIFLLIITIYSSFFPQPIYAEGSKELISNGGHRPFFEWREGTDINNIELYTGEILRKTTMYVYAQSGETLLLASNATGIGAADILYKAPDGTEGSCGPGNGIINNLQEERAGPNPANGGYTPCEVSVTDQTAGVWTIDFTSPNPTRADSNNPPPDLRTNGVETEWDRTDQPDNVNWIIAWDISVRSTDNTIIPGRTYANYMALNMGANSQSLNTLAYILTRDGYQYEANMNGMDPYGFIFFVNNSGYTNMDGNPLYKSVTFIDNELPENVSIHNPGSPDTEKHVTQKIFLNPPDSALPSSAPSYRGNEWLLNNPTYPIGENFSYTPNHNEDMTFLQGGSFTFIANIQGTYRIDIDLNNDEIFGNGNDRAFLGFTTDGNNYLEWDGLDNDANHVLAEEDSYTAQLTVQAGEIHFPFLDPEFNPNGIIITRTIPDTNSIAYYNDSSLTGDYKPDPLNALSGIDSSSGIHAFDVPDGEPKIDSNGWGNERGIDTWTYYPSKEIVTIVNGTTNDESAPLQEQPNPNTNGNPPEENDESGSGDILGKNTDENESSTEADTKNDRDIHTDLETDNETNISSTNSHDESSSSSSIEIDSSNGSPENTSDDSQNNESGEVLGDTESHTLVNVGENSLPLTFTGIIILGLAAFIL